MGDIYTLEADYANAVNALSEGNANISNALTNWFECLKQLYKAEHNNANTGKKDTEWCVYAYTKKCEILNTVAFSASTAKDRTGKSSKKYLNHPLNLDNESNTTIRNLPEIYQTLVAGEEPHFLQTASYAALMLQKARVEIDLKNYDATTSQRLQRVYSDTIAKRFPNHAASDTDYYDDHETTYIRTTSALLNAKTNQIDELAKEWDRALEDFIANKYRTSGQPLTTLKNAEEYLSAYNNLIAAQKRLINSKYKIKLLVDNATIKSAVKLYTDIVTENDQSKITSPNSWGTPVSYSSANNRLDIFKTDSSTVTVTEATDVNHENDSHGQKLSELADNYISSSNKSAYSSASILESTIIVDTNATHDAADNSANIIKPTIVATNDAADNSANNLEHASTVISNTRSDATDNSTSMPDQINDVKSVTEAKPFQAIQQTTTTSPAANATTLNTITTIVNSIVTTDTAKSSTTNTSTATAANLSSTSTPITTPTTNETNTSSTSDTNTRKPETNQNISAQRQKIVTLLEDYLVYASNYTRGDVKAKTAVSKNKYTLIGKAGTSFRQANRQKNVNLALALLNKISDPNINLDAIKETYIGSSCLPLTHYATLTSLAGDALGHYVRSWKLNSIIRKINKLDSNEPAPQQSNKKQHNSTSSKH